MLITQVSVCGAFEFVYVAIKTVCNKLPTVFNATSSLPPEVRELYKMAVIILFALILPTIINLITRFFNYLNEKL